MIDVSDIVQCIHVYQSDTRLLPAYADDLVILSTSAGGLQKSLDKMNANNDKWKLEVNLSPK